MFVHTCGGTWLKGPYLASKGPQRTEDVSAKGKRVKRRQKTNGKVDCSTYYSKKPVASPATFVVVVLLMLRWKEFLLLFLNMIMRVPKD